MYLYIRYYSSLEYYKVQKLEHYKVQKGQNQMFLRYPVSMKKVKTLIWDFFPFVGSTSL